MMTQAYIEIKRGVPGDYLIVPAIMNGDNEIVACTVMENWLYYPA